MSLLSVIQGVALRVNYSTPAAITTAFANTDPAIQLMIAMAQDAGDDAVDRVDWAELKAVQPFSFTGDGTTAAFPLPFGFRRLSPSDTFISSLYPTLQMPGPVNEDDLLAMKALPVTAQPSVWRQVALDGPSTPQAIEFFPVLGVNEVVTFYMAEGTWITDNLGAPLIPTVFTADTNLIAIPERVILQGARWRWQQAKGLDYAENMATAEGILDKLAAQQKTGRTVNMSRVYTVDDSTWFPGTINNFLDGGE